MTTLAEAAELLVLASAYDSRKPDHARARAWHDALADLDPDDCATAVRAHYRNSTDFVMPAHIRQLVRQYANERAERGHSWRQLQPAPDECVPCPPEIKAQVLQFAKRRELPA